MKLPITLQNKIIEFLTMLPCVYDSESQRAFIYSAGVDQQLQNQIQFGKSSAQFIPLLMESFMKYGDLYTGQNAIVAILEASKNYIGQDRQSYCETLLKELHANLLIKCKINYTEIERLLEIANNPEMKDDVVNFLIDSIKRPDPTERYWVYIGLGRIGGEMAECAIRQGLEDSDNFARMGAKEGWLLMGHSLDDDGNVTTIMCKD